MVVAHHADGMAAFQFPLDDSPRMDTSGVNLQIQKSAVRTAENVR
jgi:hypothetical protein